MRFVATILIAAGTMGLTGCSTLVSLHPFFDGQPVAADPALVGVWSDKDDELYIIRQDGNGYKIRHIEGGNATTYEALLYKIGDLRMLDLVSANEDPFQLAVHTPMRIWIEGSTLRFATLDSAWLKENARKQLAVQDVGDRILVTSPGDAVLRFLLTYGAGDQAYEKPAVLHRVQ
jgi:hypothetical protein